MFFNICDSSGASARKGTEGASWQSSLLSQGAYIQKSSFSVLPWLLQKQRRGVQAQSSAASSNPDMAMKREGWYLGCRGLRPSIWAILGLLLLYSTSRGSALQLRSEVSSLALDPYSFTDASTSDIAAEESPASATENENTESKGEKNGPGDSAASEKDGPSSSEVSAASEKGGPSSSEVSAASEKGGPSSSEVLAASEKGGPSSSEVSAASEKGGPSSSEVSAASEKDSPASSESETNKDKSSSQESKSAGDDEKTPSTAKEAEETKESEPPKAKEAASSEGEDSKDRDEKDMDAKEKKSPVAVLGTVSPPLEHGHDDKLTDDTFADLFGEGHSVLGRDIQVDFLREEVDPTLAKIEESIFQNSRGPQKNASDLMEASLDLGRLARGMDLGNKAAAGDNGDHRLFDSLEDDAPESLRGLISLEEQGIISGYLVRLWQTHKRLGLALRDAMSTFVNSIERERSRSASIAAVIGVNKVRRSVKGAKDQQEKTAEAKAELKMLRKQHKYLGKHRMHLQKLLAKQAANPDQLIMQLEDMWAPIDAVAAFDPGRGSNFYHSMKVVGRDAKSLAKTCAKLRVLVARATDEVTMATRQQLEKETKEEEELRAVLNPDAGPLAALSARSLSTLSRFSPQALREADNEFMGKELRDRPKEYPPPRSWMKQRPPFPGPDLSMIAGKPTQRPNADLEDEFNHQEKEQPHPQVLPLGPRELYFPFPFNYNPLKNFEHGLRATPSIIYEDDLGSSLDHIGMGSFLELKAEAKPEPERLQPHSRLSAIASHDQPISGASFVSLGDASEKEEAGEEEEEAASASEAKSASEGSETAASAKASAEGGKEPAKESEGEPKEETKQSQGESKGPAQESMGESKEQGKEPLGEAKESEVESKEQGYESAAEGKSQEVVASEGEASRAGESKGPVEAKGKPELAEKAPTITMLPELEPNSCEAITDPAICMQKEDCFQDFIYGACFFNCTTAITPEECGKHTFCRFETQVPHHACVNEGKLSRTQLMGVVLLSNGPPAL